MQGRAPGPIAAIQQTWVGVEEFPDSASIVRLRSGMNGVIFVAGLMVFALHRGLRPLDDAARGVAARSATSLTPMETGDVPREIKPLVSWAAPGATRCSADRVATS